MHFLKYFIKFLVLCRNCFEASEHRNHQYEMLRDEGGGWCDCGDRTAWREPFVFCTFHAPKYNQPPMGGPMPPVAGRKSFKIKKVYFAFLNTKTYSRYVNHFYFVIKNFHSLKLSTVTFTAHLHLMAIKLKMHVRSHEELLCAVYFN